MRLAFSGLVISGLLLSNAAFAQAPAGHPFDKDADGRVSLQEWMDAGAERRADLEDRLAKAQAPVIEKNFNNVDANKDGFLDAEELAAAKAAKEKAEAEAAAKAKN